MKKVTIDLYRAKFVGDEDPRFSVSWELSRKPFVFTEEDEEYTGFVYQEKIRLTCPLYIWKGKKTTIRDCEDAINLQGKEHLLRGDHVYLPIYEEFSVEVIE